MTKSMYKKSMLLKDIPKYVGIIGSSFVMIENRKSLGIRWTFHYDFSLL